MLRLCMLMLAALGCVWSSARSYPTNTIQQIILATPGQRCDVLSRRNFTPLGRVASKFLAPVVHPGKLSRDFGLQPR